MKTFSSPGVYKEDVYPAKRETFVTGVPVFLGYTGKIPLEEDGKLSLPKRINSWSEFENIFGPGFKDGYLFDAVRGFFSNAGQHCYIAPMDGAQENIQSLQNALDSIELIESIDLVCSPDIVRCEREKVFEFQKVILNHCNRVGDKFAIIDPIPGSSIDQMEEQQEKLIKKSGPNNGALYYPFIMDLNNPDKFVPPCGHIAGVFSRTDLHKGVHKAPANELLEGVHDIETIITNEEQDRLNPININCIRSFPGRGVRVWGARTLSTDPNWMFVNVRRLFLTVGRWIERHMVSLSFNANDPRLWVRINRELTTYFKDLFLKGALKGRSPREAFYIKCDDETNPPEVRDEGKVITEIGLAPGLPNEFIVVRIIHGETGVTITGP